MNAQDSRVKASIFPLYSFVLSFLVLGALTTGQMMILQTYLDLASIPREYIVFVVAYWIVAAAAFTLLTRYQFVRRYHKPMERFAQAIGKVARGDFSVYVPPRHLKNKMDYLDVICMDFNVMVEELGSIETFKTDFFSNVSHEIKTPLSVIQNYAQALKNDKLAPGQRAGYIDTIQESSSRLSELITNILKLNKLEKQNLQPLPEAYDLCAQLCECALLFEELWTRKNIEFIADIEDLATIEADASLLELIWNNLLSNAIKFTEPGGTIMLQQSSTDEEVIVSVSDTGCGMNEETMKYIFDKFYQGDTSRSTEGNGLGLALVLRILQLIGGSITVTSIPAVKTTFTVRIPVFVKELS
ncbi:HAMP domain-containing sensor histidine kinase [Paenibacillus sp. MMS20-IR301]|uniref:HAMP domain-containing sensor histidine kinase n=1 Tax=Paenibacillus sp. MMS20-IR301 TaxID=2895946 RepID=UPI0028EEBB26|nr:HAMP domain-containing sensor histidine kinase [Paenibacillus sp. MMS20-IR301]WNS43921.1 HAMP domain-containing sensor histidine kinase [Paenibacillus sp. MMS20-IR301]